MKKVKLHILIITVVCLGLGSCGDWLDVRPKLSIDEELLFSEEQGYKEALTGIYMSMGNASLYGRELMYGILDGLAQRYSIYTQYTDELNYKFPSTRNEGTTAAIWSKSYSVIANINNLLHWLEKKGREVVLTDGYFDIIKGEALGLRAFLHFDLLRMWGPIYASNSGDVSIIYREDFSRNDQPLEPATQIVGKIIADLEEAEELLKDDAMQISFPASDGVSGFLDFRFKRMNKFAVKALLARVYMYTGDKVNAMARAKEVIDATSGGSNLRFRLVTDNSADRIMSTELIFSLSLKEFDKQVDNDFQRSTNSLYYAVDKQHIYDIFDTDRDGFNDIRMREGQGFLISSEGAVTVKYNQTGLFSSGVKNTVPLIRLPEMYYIVAECTSDLAEATDMINTIRSARGLDIVTLFGNDEERMAAIEKECRKEFYAESQLWYFYKRLAYKRFTGYPATLPDLTEANYRFNIPEDEIVLGKTN